MAWHGRRKWSQLVSHCSPFAVPSSASRELGGGGEVRRSRQRGGNRRVALLAVCFVLGATMYCSGLRGIVQLRKRLTIDFKSWEKWVQLPLIAAGVVVMLVTGLLLWIFVLGELLLGA
jgi:hypothetical protein